MTIMKTVDYPIRVNCTEGTRFKLKTVVPVLKIFVTLTLDVSYARIVTMTNVIKGKTLTLV